MRVESSKSAKNGGWIHFKDKKDFKFVPIIPRPLEVVKKIDAFGIWKGWKKNTKSHQLISFSEKLGVDPMALHLIGAAWAVEHSAWAFPMHDRFGNVSGIRLRDVYGNKWAVTGSNQGIFLSSHPMDGMVFILEGPTDTVAAIDLGFSVIGRPSCLGCHEIIIETLKRNKIRRVVIVSDNDAPGRNGADKLRDALKIPSCTFIPPAKDFREFVNHGGTREAVECLIKDLVWHMPVL